MDIPTKKKVTEEGRLGLQDNRNGLVDVRPLKSIPSEDPTSGPLEQVDAQVHPMNCTGTISDHHLAQMLLSRV